MSMRVTRIIKKLNLEGKWCYLELDCYTDCSRDDHAVEILVKTLSFPIIMQYDLLSGGAPKVCKNLIFRQKFTRRTTNTGVQSSVILQKLANIPEKQLVRKRTNFMPMV